MHWGFRLWVTLADLAVKGYSESCLKQGTAFVRLCMKHAYTDMTA